MLKKSVINIKKYKNKIFKINVFIFIANPHFIDIKTIFIIGTKVMRIYHK